MGRRCCCECGCDCVQFEDDFSSDTIGDYDQDAGTWTVTGGKMRCSSSDGRLLCNAATAETNHSFKNFLDLSTDGDIAKLFAGWADANNHLYGLLTRSGIVADMELHEVIGGSDTTLGTLAGTAPRNGSFAISLHDGYAIFCAATGFNDPLEIGGYRASGVVSDASALGKRFGVGTGAIGSFTEFDLFKMRKLCYSCPNGDAPQCYASTSGTSCTVTFSGVVNAHCVDCNDWNLGTYILDSPDYETGQVFNLTTGFPCLGGPSTYTNIQVGLVCRNVDEVEMRFRIDVVHYSGSAGVREEVTIAAGVACCKVNCLTAIDEFTFPLSNITYDPWNTLNCDFNNATATVTFNRSV